MKAKRIRLSGADKFTFKQQEDVSTNKPQDEDSKNRRQNGAFTRRDR